MIDMEGRTHLPSERPKVGGWLLFFAISLIAVAPAGIARIVSGYPSMTKIATASPKFKGVYVITSVVEFVVIGFGVFAGVSILRARPYAVRVTKIFLLVNVLALGKWFAYELLALPAGMVPLIYLEMAAEAVSRIPYSIIWVLYLSRSRRVKATFAPRS